MDVSPLVFDLESAPLPNARDYIDPPDLTTIKAPGNYKKQDAIDGYIADQKVERQEKFERDCTDKAALDFNTARIVALGIWSERAGVIAVKCPTETDEANALTGFWQMARNRMLVGFRIREFDLPLMVQRSRLLGIPHPTPDLGRYARGNGITDLYDVLTFNDMRAETLMRRSLKAFCKRFGLPVTDDIGGAEIPALVAAGDWDRVIQHVTSDVNLTVALAKRLGIVVEQPTSVGVGAL